MTHHLLAIAALLQAAPVPSVQDMPVSLSAEQQQSFDPIGSCDGTRGPIDMHRVMFLENRAVDVAGPNGPLRVSVRRDNLYIDEFSPGHSGRRHFVDVDSLIDSTTNLDIELKLAYLEGQLVLYWKENYQNRVYRQGLFSIGGTEVTALCEGEGGLRVVP